MVLSLYCGYQVSSSPTESIIYYITTLSDFVASHIHTNTGSPSMHSIVIWYMIGRYIGYWDIHNDIQYFLPDVCVCVYVCVCVCVCIFCVCVCPFFTDDSALCLRVVYVAKLTYTNSFISKACILLHTYTTYRYTPFHLLLLLTSLNLCMWLRWLYYLYPRLPTITYLNLRSPHALPVQIHSM